MHLWCSQYTALTRGFRPETPLLPDRKRFGSTSRRPWGGRQGKGGSYSYNCLPFVSRDKCLESLPHWGKLEQLAEEINKQINVATLRVENHCMDSARFTTTSSVGRRSLRADGRASKGCSKYTSRAPSLV